MSAIIIIVGLLLAGAGNGWSQELNLVPVDSLAFSFPCGDDPKWFVQSYIVQAGNNNWEGIFYMDRFSNVFSVRLEVVLENPATITLKNTLGSVVANDDNTFVISTFRVPPDIRRIEFHVKGLSQGFFPHLISLRFNDKVLCDNSDRDLSAPFIKKRKQCGKVQVGRHQGLIANTYEASPGSWPWHVAIFHKNLAGTPQYVCGGTLISPNAVLTAAHCLFGENGGAVSEGDYMIHLGKHALSTSDENTKEFKVSRAISHQSYRKNNFINDIGLLKLEGTVEFTKYIQPICLWDELPDQRVYSQAGFVVGWGHTEKGNAPAEILREAQMPIVDSLDCLHSNRDVFGEFFSPTHYCAGYGNATSVCSGDSGGGMYIKLNGLWKIRGLVSVGAKSEDGAPCHPKSYVLFTDALRFIDWINERIDQY